MRKLYLIGWTYVAFCGFVLAAGRPGPSPPRVPAHPAAYPGEAGAWFAAAKPYCNPVEVETHLRWNPAPDTFEGASYAAACLSLAGRIAEARSIIQALPEDSRWRAAGTVFAVGHPVADAGDDLSAGPIMELVVEFWPNHYMALYHAGISRFQLGQPEAARVHLTNFLQHYHEHDGWRREAIRVLEEIGAR